MRKSIKDLESELRTSRELCDYLKRSENHLKISNGDLVKENFTLKRNLRNLQDVVEATSKLNLSILKDV